MNFLCSLYYYCVSLLAVLPWVCICLHVPLLIHRYPLDHTH